MNFDPLQWTFAIVGAFMVGMSKTGLGGLSILFVALFTHVIPRATQASGIVLPLFIIGDFVAVYTYRRHAQWRHLWRLFPATAIGVVLGYVALKVIADATARTLIGVIIVSLGLLSYWRRYQRVPGDPGDPHIHWSVAIATGVLAGFITLIANAAGPLMAVYFLAMRLPKLEYVGTGAVFFMLLNLYKVPFMMQLGLITADSLKLNLILLPAVLIGTVAGRWLLSRIDQALFEKLVLAFSTAAGVLLLL